MDKRFPCDKCETCDRYDTKDMRQRNMIFCTFKCVDYQEECLRNAHAYNYAVSGDPNIYGVDGTVWSAEVVEAED